MNIRYITASCLTVALGFIGVGTAAATTETPALTHEATPGEAATADISVTSADALAGEQLSVLILDDGADPDNPSTGDIVFIEQYVLDETGAIDFSVQLPTEILEDYDIALNTSADTQRYLASLVGTDEDDAGSDGEDGTEDPGDGATDAPDDDATDEPDDGGPTTHPDDGQTPGGEESPGNTQTPGDSDADSGTDDDTKGAPGTDSSSGDDAQQTGEDQDSGGFLASTGANIAVAIIAGLVAIGLGVVFVMRRRRMAEEEA